MGLVASQGDPLGMRQLTNELTWLWPRGTAGQGAHCSSSQALASPSLALGSCHGYPQVYWLFLWGSAHAVFRET